MKVQSLGREDALEESMAPHSSTLAWKIPSVALELQLHNTRQPPAYAWGQAGTHLKSQPLSYKRPVSRHLGGFPLMATGNSAAVNRSVPVGVLCRSASNLLPEAPLQPLWETHIRGLKNPPPPSRGICVLSHRIFSPWRVDSSCSTELRPGGLVAPQHLGS